jgi:hypothetical protein
MGILGTFPGQRPQDNFDDDDGYVPKIPKIPIPRNDGYLPSLRGSKRPAAQSFPLGGSQIGQVAFIR